MSKSRYSVSGRTVGALIKCTVAFSLWFFSALATAASGINTPVGYTPVSRSIYSIHMLAFWVSVFICAFVFIWMTINFIKYRKSKGAVAEQIHGHLGVEILWTVIPAVLLIVMAIPATKGLILIHDTEKPGMTIEVIGYQWKWRYKYLDQGIDFFSNMATTSEQINGKEKKGKWFLLEVDKPLVVPVGTKIRLLVTSNDVIHDWWVPDLGVKQDAIPGYINENWMKVEKAGTYRGECAELCGVYHGFMPIVVKAVPQAEFDQWVAKQKKTDKSPGAKRTAPKPMTRKALLAMGKKEYATHCAVCHQTNGKGLPPTFPSLVGDPITTGPLAGHVHLVLDGKAGTTMQAFKDQLSPEQLASIITYERDAWGNREKNAAAKHKIVVQAADIIKQLN
jgi:cytochrome c oxidase subunit II